MHELEKLMQSVGCIESKMLLVSGKMKHRMRFITNAAAREHRRTSGCGGWILGPFMFCGGWTPTEVMSNSEGVDGTLE